ncbi:MAG: periplasmic heavy metal sensor [Betaproteobacteria bacterium]|nr:periplasmic heavy metal sensor [Betaproteobacteria bacterium]
MKRIGAITLALAVGIAMASGSAKADQDQAGRGVAPGSSMSGMMGGPASGMMRGMETGTASAASGRERPLLTLALQHRAELGLSEDQVQTLEALVGRFRQEAGQRVREINAAERELAELLKQEPADLAQVEGKVRALEKLRADLRITRVRTIAEGRAVLAPEQRAKLDALAAGDLQPRRGEHRSGATEQGNAGAGGGTRGLEEMHRFMSSDRMPQAMIAMMDMARRMGGGDTMLGMVRMMEMMSMMGGTMGGPMHSEPPQAEKR